MVGIELQYMTLVELCDFSDIFFQTVARSHGEFDALQYNATRVNTLVDQHGVEYSEGLHFNIDVNGNIKWCPGKGPQPDIIYSINYNAPIKFRARRALHSSRFTQSTQTAGKVEFVKFPEQWLLSKDFFLKRTDVNGKEIKQNGVPGYDEGMPGDEGVDYPVDED